MKKKIILSALTFFFTIQFIKAQAPSVEWAKCFGGTDGEVGRCIRQTRDTGYIVVGNAGSNNGDVYKNVGSEDCWIVKLNQFGDTLWTRVFGGSKLDFAMSVQQTKDGGYVVAAQSNSTDGDFVGGRSGNYDCWIIKLDKSGATQWKKRFGGSGNDVPRDILITADSGYIVASSSSSNNGDVTGNHGNSDYWIFRLDKIGNIIWTKSYGGSGNDLVFSINETDDNGYLLAGQSASKNGDVWGNHGKTDYWILKISSSGDTLWSRSLGGTEDDLGQEILQTKDGGFIVGGSSQSNNFDVTGHHGDSTKADIWIVKLNSNRDIQWQKSLGGTQDEAMYGTLLAFSMMQTSEGDCIITCYTNSNDGDVSGNNGSSDVWLLKLKGTGNIEWQKSLGGSGSDYGYSIQQTNDSSIVVSGMAGVSSGDVSGNHGSVDLWVIKFAGKTKSINQPLYSKVLIYPNPSNGSITIEEAPYGSNVSITDLMGSVIFKTEVIHEQTCINISDFTSGAYIIRIEKNGYTASQKLIVQ